MSFGSGHTYTYVKDPSLNVLDAARERVREVYRRFDTVVVSTSGGKDSTVITNLAREVARERGERLQLAYIDEEIVDPPTEAYLRRVRAWPDVDFHWFAVPLKHTLRSKYRSHWWTWDPDYRDVWVRPMPDFAIQTTDFPEFDKETATHPRIMAWYFPPERFGSVCQIVGIRIQESPNRRRTLLGAGSFITGTTGVALFRTAKPIYDWHALDVWTAIAKFGWDYSQIYTGLQRAGIPAYFQRVSSWGNVSGAKDMQVYRDLFPDLWERAIVRLPEIVNMSRYATTHMYRQGTKKPHGLTWQEWCYVLLSKIKDDALREGMERQIHGALRRWSRRAIEPYPQTDLPGLPQQSWKFMAHIISKGDMKARDMK